MTCKQSTQLFGQPDQIGTDIKGSYDRNPTQNRWERLEIRSQDQHEDCNILFSNLKKIKNKKYL